MSTKKNMTVAAAGIFAFIYLLNFTFGVVELPDNLPLIGNLDEATATVILISALKYFGFDFTNIFKREEEFVTIKEVSDKN